MGAAPRACGGRNRICPEGAAWSARCGRVVPLSTSRVSIASVSGPVSRTSPTGSYQGRCRPAMLERKIDVHAVQQDSGRASGCPFFRRGIFPSGPAVGRELADTRVHQTWRAICPLVRDIRPSARPGRPDTGRNRTPGTMRPDLACRPPGRNGLPGRTGSGRRASRPARLRAKCRIRPGAPDVTGDSGH